jgi:tetratricopeptide (TPR) repeat protein
VPTENLVFCDGIERQLANTLLAARDQNLALHNAKHPLLGMPGFVNDLIAGRTEHEAVEHFERENRMAERAGRLSREGTLFASWLFATEGVAATAFDNRVGYAEKMKDFGMAAPVIVAGIENAVEATVILAGPDALLLAPEFMLLGERWFPNWRTDSRPAFQILCAAFATLAAHDKVDVDKDSRLLDWAIRLEDWTTAALICVAICRWYGEHGRLEDMKATIERLLPEATGMERIVLRGHLVTIATNHGDYRTGLAENQRLETDLQDLPRDDDYYRNLQASITQQIDCLRELGRLEEAEQRWRDAHDLLPRLTDRAEGEARLLGQLAHLRREQNEMDAALDAASKAVQLAVADHCPAVLIAELRHTRADLLWHVGRDREAVEELNVIASTPMPPALRSRFLHLKALLLERHGGPKALEHLLESYEQDRLRGDDAGVAISLLAIARVFTEGHEYDRARERIREALPLADACGLANVVASLALLWADIDLAEGKTTSAASWLATARTKFAESQDEGGVAHATRLLDTLRARAE